MKLDSNKKLTTKLFFNNILSGTALGIIVGLLPNAILSALLNLLGDSAIINTLNQVVVIFQLTTPIAIGGIIALQFGFNPLKMAIVAGSAFVGSGVVKLDEITGVYVGSGTGDIINTMITAAIAVSLILLVAEKFGSASIVLTPVVIGTLSGFIGVSLLPYVGQISIGIGNGINTFTALQPLLMSILIACSFAILIISPLSTVAIGMAIQLNGISAGAAAMGVTATTMVLIVNSWKVNDSGVTLAIALGAMKMMMPNLFKHPIILLPALFTAIISAIPVAILEISGVPSSAGFGLVGLVGPLASIEAGLPLMIAIICWLIIPVIAVVVGQILFEKILNLYKKDVVFAFIN